MPRKLKETEFYSVKLRERVNVPKFDICVKVFPNKKRVDGIPALVAEYEGSTLVKFIKVADKERMIEKYGKC